MRIYIIVLCLIATHAARAEAPQHNSALRLKMQRAFSAFQELQPFLYQRGRFADPAHEKKISELISKLAQNFHSVETLNEVRAEPAFTSTLQVLNEMLHDSLYRFREGKKEYALWRLRTASTYCVTCHTRFETKQDFFDPSLIPNNLTAFERGEFLLATRQFEKAAEAFLEAAISPQSAPLRMHALRLWLLIYVRVRPDPAEAMKTLERITLAIKPIQSEREEIDDWHNSLAEWLKESPAKRTNLELAEALIERGIHSENILEGRRGTVDLLRATALLHKTLEKNDLPTAERARSLYLLGLAYRQLPLFFANELPEMLLEQCIREAPGTLDAKRAFRLYEEIVTLGYTGSSGINLPDDVRLQLQELRDIAYGTAAFNPLARLLE